MKSRHIIVLLASTIILIVAVVSMGISAESQKRQREINNMQEALREATYSIDKDKYSEAVLFLCSSDVNDKEKVEEAKNKFNGIIDDSLMQIIESNATVEINTNMENMDMETTYSITQDIESDDKSYPIYGDYLKIVGYGTKEESEQSLKEFAEQPTNVIKESSVYKDTLLFRVVNKVSGERIVRVQLENGKIIDYKTYMRGRA